MTTLIELDQLAPQTDRGDLGVPRQGTFRAPRRARPSVRTDSPADVFTSPVRDEMPRCVGVARFVAPSRFDTHRVAEFAGWIAESASADDARLLVDLSKVEFIDMAAFEALVDAGERHRVELVDLSLAALVTFRLIASATDRIGVLEPAMAA